MDRAQSQDRPAVVINVSRPPSANRMNRTVSGMKRPVLDRDYARWLETAGWEARRQFTGGARIDCRFNVVIYVPTSARDTDNWFKPLMDLMQHAGVVSNDGNMHEIRAVPMDREDCAVALFLLPDMGGIRPPARSRKRTGGPAKKPDRRTLDKLTAMRGRVMF